MERLAVFFIFVTLFLSGCYLNSRTKRHQGNRIVYSLRLEGVERPIETKNRWGEITRIDLAENNRYHYEDKMIDSYFLVLTDRIEFEIFNKTEHSIKLLWNETSYIDFGGSSARIMHAGVKYVDRNASQPPSVIPAKGRLTDVILPTNRVYYREGYYGAYLQVPGGWEHIGLVLPDRDLLPTESATIVLTDSTRNLAKSAVSQKVGVLLPLEIQGTVNEYTFWFQVTGYQVLSEQDQSILEEYDPESGLSSVQVSKQPHAIKTEAVREPSQAVFSELPSNSPRIIGEISKIIGNYGVVDLTMPQFIAIEGMILTVYDNQFLLDSTLPKTCDVEVIKVKSSVLGVKVKGSHTNQMLMVGQLVIEPKE